MDAEGGMTMITKKRMLIVLGVLVFLINCMTVSAFAEEREADAFKLDTSGGTGEFSEAAFGDGTAYSVFSEPADMSIVCWHKLEVPADSTLSWFGWSNRGESYGEPVVTLYDSNKKLIDDSATGHKIYRDRAAWTNTLAKGSYYVRVTGEVQYAIRVILKSVPVVQAQPQTTEQIRISQKPTVTSVKSAGKKKISVKWKKFPETKKKKAIWKKIKKVEIQYSTDKSFKNGTKRKTVKRTKTSVTIKGLKKKTVYYVRVRYLGSNGECSKWSKVKTIRVKK